MLSKLAITKTITNQIVKLISKRMKYNIPTLFYTHTFVFPIFPFIVILQFSFFFALSQSLFYICPSHLSFSSVLPICPSQLSFSFVLICPFSTAAIVGIIFYKEIQGLKNYAILGIVFLLAVTGSILVALSKMDL